MNLPTRWMSFRTFQLALTQYPGPKVGLVHITEEYLPKIPGFVLATRTNDNGEKEYLLNCAWAPR
jgi:hypothetical protein